MFSIILVIHLLITLALIVVVLMQRSEGGGLGIGGGPGGGGAGFLTGRGTANLLTKTTAVLAAAFMMTSVALTILSGGGVEQRSILQEMGEEGLQPLQPLERAPDSQAPAPEQGGAPQVPVQ